MNRKFAILTLAAALLIVVVVLWRDASWKQVLPDGTTLVLSGVQVARTNVYTHGSALSKLLGRAIPSNGIAVAGFKLRRPRAVVMPIIEGGESLMGELWLAPGSPRESRLVSMPFYRKYRLLISGDDGYAFVNEFNGFKRFDDGLFAQIWAYSFPRDSRTLHFRLEERDRADTRAWRELATFVVKNPKRSPVESWKPEPPPRFKLPEDLELEIGEVSVRHEPIHPTDIWEYTASLPVRITQHGQSVTNWGIVEGKVEDATGNRESVHANKIMTNGWMVHHMFHPADPAKPWKFHLHLGRDSDFPATNLFSFAVPFPMPGPVETNLGGFPCRIEFVNTTMLSVLLTNKPPGTRLTFVRAVDDQGKDLDDHFGSWGQFSFWKGLKLMEWLGRQGRTGVVHATVTIRPEYEVEFTLRPRDGSKAKQ